MKTTLPNYGRRRLIGLIVLTALAAATGFIWGHTYGYRQGQQDTIEHIEHRLNTPPPGPTV